MQRRNGKQIMIAGAGVIILVLVLGMFFMNRGGGSTANPKGTTAAAPTNTTPVVVALQAIPQGTTFLAGQPLQTFFAVRQVPNSIAPFGAYASLSQIDGLLRSAGCQPVQVAGCRGQVTTSQTIYQNLPVVAGMFTTLGQFRTTAGPAFQIPYGYVAIAVPFSATNSVLGSIQPGDDIDLIASYTYGQKQFACNSQLASAGDLKQTQYVLNDVRVIGVGGPPPSPATSLGAKGTSSGTTAAPGATTPVTGDGGSLLLLVRYQEALIVQNLKDFAGSWTISAVLRSAKETDIPHFHTLPVFGRWFWAKQANQFDCGAPY